MILHTQHYGQPEVDQWREKGAEDLPTFLSPRKKEAFAASVPGTSETGGGTAGGLFPEDGGRGKRESIGDGICGAKGEKGEDVEFLPRKEGRSLPRECRLIRLFLGRR